jgi:hypothetical protein
MGKMRTEVCGKQVILLNGTCPYAEDCAHRCPIGEHGAHIEAPEKLIEAARRDPDAVAFGFLAGRWISAA